MKGFGRRKMDLTPNEIYNLVIYQLGALSGFCKINHVKMMHVKPHGALYQMGLEIKVAHAIAQAVFDFDSNLIFVGLANTLLISEAELVGLKVASKYLLTVVMKMTDNW